MIEEGLDVPVKEVLQGEPVRRKVEFLEESPPRRIEEQVQTRVQTRPRKPGKTLEDVVNANYCPPPLWLEKKEVAKVVAEVHQRSSELVRPLEVIKKRPTTSTKLMQPAAPA